MKNCFYWNLPEICHRRSLYLIAVNVSSATLCWKFWRALWDVVVCLSNSNTFPESINFNVIRRRFVAQRLNFITINKTQLCLVTYDFYNTQFYCCFYEFCISLHLWLSIFLLVKNSIIETNSKKVPCIFLTTWYRLSTIHELMK